MTTMSVVGECFFWYRLTRVVPDKFHRAVKRLCVSMPGFPNGVQEFEQHSSKIELAWFSEEQTDFSK